VIIRLLGNLCAEQHWHRAGFSLGGSGRSRRFASFRWCSLAASCRRVAIGLVSRKTPASCRVFLGRKQAKPEVRQLPLVLIGGVLPPGGSRYSAGGGAWAFFCFVVAASNFPETPAAGLEGGVLAQRSNAAALKPEAQAEGNRAFDPQTSCNRPAGRASQRTVPFIATPKAACPGNRR